MKRNKPRNKTRTKILITPKTNPALRVIANDLAGMVPETVKHATFDGGSRHEVREALTIRTQQIAIGIPFDELAFSQFTVSVLGLHIMPWDMPITTMSTYLPMARNQIHNIFLENPDQGTHLLMLDSDVLCPPKLIDTLLSHKLPMVGGWYRKKEKYPIKHEDGTTEITQRPVVYDYDEEKRGYIQKMKPGVGLEKVGGAGAGCWLMSREVAEAIGKSPYGEDAGEDLVLCGKVANAGFDMWIDWSLACAHAGVFFV